jgi:CheY-like chemotaxis protein
VSEPIRVAVADDEPIMRMYFEDVLPDLGYSVVSSAENGQELVAHCRQHHPDLIVTDIRMPQIKEALQHVLQRFRTLQDAERE